MTFAHDTDEALRSAAALINTAEEQPDVLTDRRGLDAFVATWRWTGRRTGDRAELDAVRALRPRLREIWLGSELRRVAAVNALLRDARALPQLVRHDEWGWHLHATGSEQPLAQRMAVEAAMAVVDVVRSGETDRLKECAASDCAHVLVDLSRNRSRRFCEAGCGNRLAVAAYRARQADRAD